MSRPKLLLADDSTTIQKVVNLTFADQGMDVFTFSDGESAIERFDEIKPDIVLADVHMPGIGGYRLCELVRSNELSRNTPVVLLVGSFEPFDRDEAARVGANGHLTKPFTSIADLVTTVEDLVKRSSQQLQAVAEAPPDTSDIDSLYQQSFAETVEIPKNGADERTYEFDELDDEMIQTSYAGQDDESSETFYPVDELEGSPAENGEIDRLEAESLIAESVPQEADAEQAFYETTGPEPVPSGPFDSVAAEPPSVPVSEAMQREEIKFAIEDMDLLELPGSPRQAQSSPVEVAADKTSSGHNSAELSPELIDLIVDKVVERLEQRAKTGAAHSGSGN